MLADFSKLENSVRSVFPLLCVGQFWLTLCIRWSLAFFGVTPFVDGSDAGLVAVLQLGFCRRRTVCHFITLLQVPFHVLKMKVLQNQSETLNTSPYNSGWRRDHKAVFCAEVQIDSFRRELRAVESNLVPRFCKPTWLKYVSRAFTLPWKACCCYHSHRKWRCSLDVCSSILSYLD